MKKDKQVKRMADWESPGPWFAVIIVILLGIIVAWGSWFTVSEGNTALVFTWGKATSEPYGAGLHFKVPIMQSVQKFSTRTQVYGAEGTKDTLESANSKDLQQISMRIAVNYDVPQSNALVVYQKIGAEYETNVIKPIVDDTVRAVFAQYNAEEISLKREEIRQKMKDVIQQKLSARNIVLEDVNIINFDYSKQFSDAIEAKVTAEQLRQKAENDLARIKVEAEQKIAAAQAEAESLRLQKEVITPELIELRRIEMQQKAIDKWDGKLPSVTGSTTPFIDVSSKVATTS